MASFRIRICRSWDGDCGTCLVTFNVKVETVLKEFTEILFNVSTFMPQESPNIQNRYTLFLANLFDSFSILFRYIEIAINSPWRISWIQVLPPLVSIHRWRCEENNASDRRIVRWWWRGDFANEGGDIVREGRQWYVLVRWWNAGIVRSIPYRQETYFRYVLLFMLFREELGTWCVRLLGE